MNVGFIGLGRMGKPMARHLLDAGHTLTVHNRSQGPVRELAALGAHPAAAPADVARASDVVFTCLTNTPAVDDVYFADDGLVGAARSGQVFVDCSTVSPSTSKQCAEAARSRGADFLDAPVSGGPAGAQAGSLTIMVGGNPQTFERVLPLFQAMGQNIRLVGPLGAGSTIKLVNQLLVAINSAAVAEAMVLGTKAGADPRVIFDVLKTSFGGSTMLTRNVPMMLDRNFSGGTTINLILKDLGLIDDLGGEIGVRTLLGAIARQEFREGKALGLGDEDLSGLVQVIERDAGVEVK
jgi:3-hydroxyisobutyrate dehydrogenase/2-hydroxy-3-oxopropionate reductase